MTTIGLKCMFTMFTLVLAVNSNSIAGGREISVVTVRGDTILCELLSVREHQLVVLMVPDALDVDLYMNHSLIQTIDFSDISRVYAEGKSNVLKGMGIGAGIGLVSGLIVAGATTSSEGSDPGAQAGAGLGAGLAGAGLMLGGMIVGSIVGVATSEKEINIQHPDSAAWKSLVTYSRYGRVEPTFLQILK